MSEKDKEQLLNAAEEFWNSHFGDATMTHGAYLAKLPKAISLMVLHIIEAREAQLSDRGKK